MGFFKNLTKSLNPVKHVKDGFKDPWQSAKNNLAAGLDPAGSVVRTGRGKEAMPTNVKDAYDPGGFVAGPPAPAPNSYAPQSAMTLSPGAQALYDQMKARTAARTSGVPYNPAPAAQATPQLAHRTPLGQQAPQTPYDPGLPPQQLADGGMVEDEYDGEYFESKAFERKPNGKPY